MSELRTDAARERETWNTGILVRARDSAGQWGNFDIGQLDTRSLIEWLAAEPHRAIQVVQILLWGTR